MRGVKVRERLIHSRIAHVFHASLLRMNFPPLIRLTQQNTLLRVIHYKDVQGLSVCLSDLCCRSDLTYLLWLQTLALHNLSRVVDLAREIRRSYNYWINMVKVFVVLLLGIFFIINKNNNPCWDHRCEMSWSNIDAKVLRTIEECSLTLRSGSGSFFKMVLCVVCVSVTPLYR